MASIPPRLLFILVDGLGIGPRDATVNPIYSGACPHLQQMLDDHAVPVDATMGVPGIPQSATGQTALMTGVNAARVMGRHVEGFPGPALRDVIRAENLYDKLLAQGRSATFANAYYVTDIAEVLTRRVQSVTTVAALKAFGKVRDVEALLSHQAVYHDLTRESLRERGYEGPLTTPEESARDLLKLAAGYNLTLFEYFQTDRVGHRGTDADVRRILSLFDAFLAGIVPFSHQPGCTLIMTSDHGNIEEAGSPFHSRNPVPFVARGHDAGVLKARVRSVTDVTPAIVELFSRSVSAARACRE